MSRVRGPKRPEQATEYIETESGNRISRKSAIQGSQFIILGGKTLIEAGAVVRGDCHRRDSNSPIIAIGRYCYLGPNCSIKPPQRFSTSSGKEEYYPIKVGSYVHIGQGSTVEAATIGSCVYIGDNCKIGKFSIIKDCVVIKDNTVIPPYAVISHFSMVSQEPPNELIQLPESADQVLEVHARKVYSGIQVDPPF